MSNEPLSTDDLLDAPPPPAGPAPPAAQAPASRRKALPVTKGNLLLAGLFALGLVAVYVLRLQSGPQKASAQMTEAEQKVQVAIDLIKAPKGALAADAKGVVDTFYYEATQRQVPVSQLSKNPFVFVRPEPQTPKAVAREQAPDAPREQPAAQEAADALKAAQAMHLQSVLESPRGAAAMIDNNVLTEGQMIQGWKIVKIGSSQVVLQWREETFVLKMNP